MSWRLAKSLETLRKQVNEKYPKRSKASDGTIGDAAHQGTVSDHNPNVAGVVTALDLTHDPKHLDAGKLADALVKSKDKRIKYIIWNRRIWMGRWEPYYGDNPHNKHVHISVAAQPTLFDDKTKWRIDDMYKGKSAERWASAAKFWRKQALEARAKLKTNPAQSVLDKIKSLLKKG